MKKKVTKAPARPGQKAANRALMAISKPNDNWETSTRKTKPTKKR